ncbi:MAG: TraC family protein [bacterium]
MRSADKKGKPTQQLVPLKEVRDGIAVLSDGTLRSILIVSSLNFALKSEDEQNAIVLAFQDFLNSLDFPVQITVVSRKLDITPYLEELRGRKEGQSNELLRLQMDEYINFVAELVKGSDVMAKTFLVTVPFSVQQSRQDNFLQRFIKSLKNIGKKSPQVSEADFVHYRSQLLQRVEQVAVGLRGVGLRLVPLQTQEMLELFYDTFNPATSRNQPLGNAAQLKVRETESHELVAEEANKKPWAGK